MQYPTKLNHLFRHRTILYRYILLKTITQPYIGILLCLIITSLANGRKMRLVGLLGNHLFACPNHVPSPENERQLSTGLGLTTQVNEPQNDPRFDGQTPCYGQCFIVTIPSSCLRTCLGSLDLTVAMASTGCVTVMKS